MKHLRRSAIVLSAFISFSCTTKVIPSPVGVADLKSALHDGRNIVDIAKKWTNSNPRAASSLKFEDLDRFDMQMHRSMKEYEVIQLNIDETYTPSTLPSRLEPWLTTIQESKGTVRVCTIDSNFAGLSVLTNLIYSWVKGIDEFVTYAPSKAYDAEILINSFAPKKVVRIEFISRFSKRNRRKACAVYEPET